MPDVLSRGFDSTTDTLLISTSTESTSLPCNLPVDLSQIDMEKNNDPEIQELAIKVREQSTEGRCDESSLCDGEWMSFSECSKRARKCN